MSYSATLKPHLALGIARQAAASCTYSSPQGRPLRPSRDMVDRTGRMPWRLTPRGEVDN